MYVALIVQQLDDICPAVNISDVLFICTSFSNTQQFDESEGLFFAMKQLERQNDNLHQCTATQATRLAQLEQLHADELRQLTAKLVAVERVAAHQHRELTDLRQHSAAQRSQLDAHTGCAQEAVNARSQIHRLQAHINQLADERRTGAADTDQRHDRYRLHDENAQLAARLADLERDHATVCAERDALSERMASGRRRTHAAAQTEQQRLTAELNDNTDALCQLGAENARLRVALEECRARHDNLSGTYGQLHKRLAIDWDTLCKQTAKRAVAMQRNGQRIDELTAVNEEMRTRTERLDEEVRE